MDVSQQSQQNISMNRTTEEAIRAAASAQGNVG